MHISKICPLTRERRPKKTKQNKTPNLKQKPDRKISKSIPICGNLGQKKSSFRA